ncbi:glycoside hydrolase family 2 TIM barrel-domain containing protein [Microbulbifer sp. YPW1]|uniref:glycoside hydrolase family 2 protein n=1 Tax=Microbulbifer sp. YPW1 TaxID=2745199 RepID=UPI00159A3078|nr:glycoside hydrolase family 2 TIM barrel-domain containing protein [Microbulbifer sp. YPW1]QKX16991.1 glycoside hydrolase family 2 protein [Microbulbifer sp. YPW1]
MKIHFGRGVFSLHLLRYKDLSRFSQLGRLLLCACVTALIAGCNAEAGADLDAQQPWEVRNFNSDWFYLPDEIAHNGDRNLPAFPGADSPAWEKVTLPHTWNATDTVDATPGYRRAASWYAKTFTADAGSRYRMHFESANMVAEVFVNGQKVGEHVGGYVGFDVELTEALKRNSTNEVLVRVSNEYDRNLIPSQKADFFLFGGLTRDVWLQRLPETFIQRVAVSTPQVSHTAAQTQVSVSLDRGNASAPLTLDVRLLDGDKQEIQRTSTEISASSSDDAPVHIDLAQLDNPQLWSPDTPHLYAVEVTLKDAAGQILHQKNEAFGYRWFEMRPNQGFFVNGEQVLIRGTHRHEEHAGIGPAMSNALHRNDMQQIKDMGANFVRLAHYPQDPEVYRAANELGLIVWDELPWCRGGKGGEVWEANTERLLREQIAQNYNHPSIAFWSLGNEMYWEEDFAGGGADEEVLPYLKHLNRVAKELDPSRMTTIRKYYPGADVVDAFSPSIWAGWYGGAYGQYAAALEDAMGKYPTFLHMEYGGSGHKGRHTETPLDERGIPDAQVSVTEAMNQAVVKSIAKDTDWNESYIVNLFDWHLSVSESTENFAGNAQWAFKDFGTPLRPENPLPYINQKGLTDRAGNPKDAYYVFASYWAKQPFCYIESHSWTVRYGPKAGRPVKVYCNTDSAELFLNGDSLGSKTRRPGQFPAHGLVWQVPFREGENQLRVVGKNRADGQSVEDGYRLTYYVGEPAKTEQVVLTASRTGNDTFLITAEAQDKQGRRATEFSDRGYFSVLNGGGQLQENQGTYTGSSTIEMANGMAAIEFIPGARPAVVEFRTQNIKGVYIDLPAAGDH